MRGRGLRFCAFTPRLAADALLPPQKTPFFKTPGSHRDGAGGCGVRYLCNRGQSRVRLSPPGKEPRGGLGRGRVGAGSPISSCRRGSLPRRSPALPGRALSPRAWPKLRQGPRAARLRRYPREGTNKESGDVPSGATTPSPAAVSKPGMTSVRLVEGLFWLLPSHSSSGGTAGGGCAGGSWSSTGFSLAALGAVGARPREAGGAGGQLKR